MLLGQASRLFEAPGLTNKSVQIYCQVCPVLIVSCQIGGFDSYLKASSTSPSASNLRAKKIPSEVEVAPHCKLLREIVQKYEKKHDICH